MTNNNKVQVDLPVFEWMRFSPANTSSLTALTTARDGYERYMYYFYGSQLYRYDTYGDTWQTLSVGATPVTALAAQYVKNQGFVGNVLSVPTSTSLQIPSTNSNNLAGYKIKIQSGAGAGQVRTITASTSEVVHDMGLVTTVTTSVMTDTVKRWKQNQWVGYGLKLIFNTGFSQYREILYNDATSATVYDANYEGRVSSSTPFNTGAPYGTPVVTAGSQVNFLITSQTITVDSPWTIQPDSSSQFEILSGGIWWLSSNASSPYFNFYFYDILSDRWITKLTPAGLMPAAIGGDFTIEPIADNLFTTPLQSTVTSATSKTLYDSSITLTNGDYNNFYLYITAGTGVGQKRRITSNTSNTFSISAKWDTIPDGTSQYCICVKEDIFFEGNIRAQMLKYYPVAAGGVWTSANIIDAGIANNLSVTRTNKLVHGVTTVTRAVNAIRSVNPIPTAGGTNYLVGDILTISTGGSLGRVYVEEINPLNGAVTRVSLYTAGNGYTTGTGKATTGGAGTSCTIEITALGITGVITTAINNDIKFGESVTINGLSEFYWNHTYTVIGVQSAVIFEVLILDQALFNTGTGFNAAVSSVAVQSDGKMIVGGSFTSYNGTTANRIIRLNTDGSIDTTFVYGTGFDASPNSIVLQSDGKILVGGTFTTYQGVSANKIIRLNSNGNIDSSFVYGTGFDGNVSAIAIQSNGKILCGGSFTSYNGTSYIRLIRLETNGTIDSSLVVGTSFTGGSNYLTCIAIQPDGKIVVGGSFTAYKGTTQKYIARLLTNGDFDSGFSASSNILTSGLLTVAIQPDGKILAGGYADKYLNRFNVDGSIDATFLIGAGFTGNYVYSLAIQSDGKIIVGGGFFTYQGVAAGGIIRLNPDASKDTSFITGVGFDSYVLSIIVQSDGKILFGGQFTTYAGGSYKYLLQTTNEGKYITATPTALHSLSTSLVQDLTKNWTPNEFAGKLIGIQSNGLAGALTWRKILGNGTNTISFIAGVAPTNGNSRYFVQELEALGKDSSYLPDNQMNYGYVTESSLPFNSGSGFDTGIVSAIVNMLDYRVLLGGSFTAYQGVAASGIIRLNGDGSIDNTFIYGTGFGGGLVITIALQSDGKILVGGSFASYNGTGANCIIRLNSDGSVDNTFIYGTGFGGGNVLSVVLQSNGKIIVAGYFTSYSGVGANGIIRLNSDGSIDSSFVYGTGFNGLIYSVVLQLDGKILVGGGFTSYNGTSANRIIRLNSDGSIDLSFAYGSGFNAGSVNTIAVQLDGKILLGGNFTTYQGMLTNGIIRINSNGSIDNTFTYGTGFNLGNVDAIALQSNNKILVGGDFTSYNGMAANRIVSLNSDGTINTLFIGGGTNDEVSRIYVLPNDNVFIGGFFTTYQGISVNKIIRINSDGSYYQNPYIADSTKSWYSAAYNSNKIRLLNTNTGDEFEDIITSSTPNKLVFGRTIALGAATNTISYSNDGGLTYTGLGATIFSTQGNNAIWNGTRFVAVGQGTNTIAYSNDGINWVGLGATIFTTAGQNVCWNGVRFVAVGSGTNTIAWSNDGITWTGAGATIFSTAGYGVAWNGTRFIAVGEGTNTIAWSYDGITWIGEGTTIFTTRGRGIVYSGSKFVAVGVGTNSIAYSTDGFGWTGGGTSIFSTGGYNVTWNGTRFVAVGQGTNTIAYSSDGASWTGLGASIFSTQGNGIAWNGTRFIAAGSGTNTVAYSANGIGWVGLGAIFSSAGYGVASTSPFASVYPNIGLVPNLYTKYEIQDTYGTATGTQSTTQLQDLTKKWKVNQWAGKRLLCTSGTAAQQEVSITSNTANALTFAAAIAPDATTTYTILGRPQVSTGIELLWNFGATSNKGKYLISPRGGGSHTFDIYDIAKNKWNFGNFIWGQGELLSTGTMYAYDGANRVYYQANATGKIYYYDFVKNEIHTLGTVPYGMSTAILSNRMEIIKTTDGLQYLYLMRHTGQEFWRVLINW